MPAFVRLGTAAFVSDNLKNFRNRPKKPIELYEFEGCPFCRKVLNSGTYLPCIAPACFVAHHETLSFLLLQVREACTLLDIDVLFYPCPKGGPTWRPKVILHKLYLLHQQEQVPYHYSMDSFTAKFHANYLFRQKSFDMLQSIHGQFAASYVGGAAQWEITFPIHGRPNTRQQMGESDDIIVYLYNEYGDGNVPLLLKLGPLTAISNTLALLPR